MSEILHGAYRYTVDEKGRLIIPRPFREAIGSPLALLPWHGPSLLAVSPLAAAALPPELAAQRHLVTPHPSSGRVLIPDMLREHAGIHPYEEAVVAAAAGGGIIICVRRLWKPPDVCAHLSRLTTTLRDLEDRIETIERRLRQGCVVSAATRRAVGCPAEGA